ncbi:hypothetical protein JTE90_004579 [Oedothorax gibbosus]|uniref:Uncharacterized protein n=1 Tax=Oedothorax gibbosus TaxID=931172 RepID=A0AAV6UJI1_9ARAC|nr:hypothetical protein JTE90_004579 [Oedothorax gibbosus]
MKSSGGLTRGRGITDSLPTRWTMGLAAFQNVCAEVENYCSCLSATTDQHIDMRCSRIRRDDDDATKLTEWFSNHNPFPNSPHLMSISSGLIGGEDVNCHL